LTHDGYLFLLCQFSQFSTLIASFCSGGPIVSVAATAKSLHSRELHGRVYLTGLLHLTVFQDHRVQETATADAAPGPSPFSKAEPAAVNELIVQMVSYHQATTPRALHNRLLLDLGEAPHWLAEVVGTTSACPPFEPVQSALEPPESHCQMDRMPVSKPPNRHTISHAPWIALKRLVAPLSFQPRKPYKVRPKAV